MFICIDIPPAEDRMSICFEIRVMDSHQTLIGHFAIRAEQTLQFIFDVKNFVLDLLRAKGWPGAENFRQFREGLVWNLVAMFLKEFIESVNPKR